MRGLERFWEEVHHTFDPDEPVRVDVPQLHVARERKYNALTSIERKIIAPTRGHHRFLLTGAVGNGKSSELNAFVARLARRRIVVSFDLRANLQNTVGDPKALDRIKPWELLGYIGLALYRAGTDQLGHRWKGGEARAFQAALETLRNKDSEDDEGASLDIGELANSMTVVVGSTLGAAVAGPVGAVAGSAAAEATTKVFEAVGNATKWGSWKIGRNSANVPDDQDGDVRELSNAVNRLIEALQEAYARRILLVVDGPDRIVDPERSEALFVNSSLLGDLPCDVLMTAPLGHMRRFGQRIEPFDLKHLHNIPVLDRSNPAEPGSGLSFFRELTERRLKHVRELLARDGVEGPEDPLPVELINRLAYFSGGLTRDFVTMVRIAAAEALMDQLPKITSEVVELVLRERRDSREFYMDKAQIKLLEGVMADPHHELPGDDLALKLLAEKRLLAYPNNTPWFYPHPLLTLALLNRTG